MVSVTYMIPLSYNIFPPPLQKIDALDIMFSVSMHDIVCGCMLSQCYSSLYVFPNF